MNKNPMPKLCLAETSYIQTSSFWVHQWLQQGFLQNKARKKKQTHNQEEEFHADANKPAENVVKLACV